MATEKKGMSSADFEAAIFELEGSSEYKNILVYGDSGVGKTVLAGSLPGKNFWFAGEPGYISAIRLGGKGKGRLIPDTASALAGVAWLEDGAAKEFDWLVVDGASTMGNKFLLGYAAEAFDANPMKRAHRNLPDKPDYFNTQNFMKGWVARLIDLPCNVLITAHTMRTEDTDGELLVLPGIQGKGGEVSNYICGLMHCVGYLDIRMRKTEGKPPEEVRRLLWRETRDPKTDVKYFAKDQFNMLPRWMDDTNMTEVLQTIDAGEEQPAAPVPVKATRRRARA